MTIFGTALILSAVAIYASAPLSAQGIKITRSNNAGAPKLRSPVDCEVGKNCWIVNYVDVEPAQNEVKDFMCNPRSYEGHKGTDFGIADRVTMHDGVNVLSATDGTVLRLRDNVPDRPPLDSTPYEVKEGKECGNGVLVELDRKGWQLAYCHLKQNSIKVKPGDRLKAGDVIGEIGQSGNADFPHLHLSIYKDQITIDPFTSKTDEKGCGQEAVSMWKEPEKVKYTPIDIYAAGFKDHAPEFSQIKIDASNEKVISRNSSIFAFWAAFYGVRKDDQVHLEIIAPDGSIYSERSFLLPKDRARQFYFIGRKTRSAPLKVGTYIGNIKVTRVIDGQVKTFTKQVETRVRN